MSENPFAVKMRAKNEEKSRCEFCKAVKKLPKQKFRQLLEALEAPHAKSAPNRINHSVILEVLAEWGINTNYSTISDHRRGERPSCMASLKEHAS